MYRLPFIICLFCIPYSTSFAHGSTFLEIDFACMSKFCLHQYYLMCEAQDAYSTSFAHGSTFVEIGFCMSVENLPTSTLFNV